MEETFSIARLSVEVAIHRLAHGGAAGAGHGATSPTPVAPLAAAPHMLPSGVTMSCVRRGATARVAAKENMIYAVRGEGEHAIRGSGF